MTTKLDYHAPKIGFVSLGCPKAGSDTEKVLSQVRSEGYDIADDYKDAGLVIVNTCGFIDSAIDESLDAIDEALNENGNVIVMGCLGEKKHIIEARFNNLLAITGSEAFSEVMDAVHQHIPKPHDPYVDLIPPQGVRLTPNHYSYIKISEGCNHKCSFCIIPSMRGKLASRPIGNIMNEAERLVDSGASELLIISQDTSAYGVDIKYRTGFWDGKPIKSNLYDLAKNLGELGVWIRLHYVYPYPHVDKIISLMADGKILPYIDVPFQHANHEVLKRMKRPANSENNLERILEWRKICPEIAIRSTFIVGFPGETEAQFNELLQFIEEAQLERVGCFKYSNVDGATANLLSGNINEQVKQERYNRLMELQSKISFKKLKDKVGSIQTVLIDEVNASHAIARSYANAPDIDGHIFLETPEGLQPGDMLDVKINRAEDYDLFAGPIKR
ncbi:30S ribosomal protein S12 methylthiotransferase RimO [Methylophilaceae bacterium]|jgi:ribosomal protein S12 methylthiotransferase|nr:30S ribosomal protein S12 methylthiotransferase RimO [Methylophilaceae bacterium]